MNVGAVPCDEILAGDGGDGGILRLAGIGIVLTISQPGGFTGRDAANLIVAPRDAVFCLLLSKLDLVGAEFRILQEVGEDFEYIVEVALQAAQSDGGGIGTAAGLDLGGTHFEKVVELVAGLRPGAAG